MARKKKRRVSEKDLEGFKLLELLEPFLKQLQGVGAERDVAGNRDLYFDQYTALVLLYFFSPIVTSLRGLQQATELKKVQERLGISRVSLGSLSEASRVFDAAALQGVIAELADRALPLAGAADLKALEGLTAVDGSLLPALPRMAWALWVDETHRAAKMHLAFEVLRGVPVKVSVTEGNGSEKNELRKMLEAGRLYVVDRGYAEYQLFQEIIDANSSFVGRIRSDANWTAVKERPVSPEAKATGVLSDREVWLGGKKSCKALKQTLRIVEVDTGKKPTKRTYEMLCFFFCGMADEGELLAHLNKLKNQDS